MLVPFLLRTGSVLVRCVRVPVATSMVMVVVVMMMVLSGSTDGSRRRFVGERRRDRLRFILRFLRFSRWIGQLQFGTGGAFESSIEEMIEFGPQSTLLPLGALRMP